MSKKSVRWWLTGVVGFMAVLWGPLAPLSAAVQIITEGPQKDVIIKLEGPALGQPLVIGGDPAQGIGGLFFETPTGKIWLRGDPNNLTQTPQGLNAEWMVEGTIKVVLAITTDNKDFEIRVSAGLPDVQKWGLNLRAMPEEYFTGLFERTVPGKQDLSWQAGITTAMNIRGLKVEMMLDPTLTVYAPFYLSSQGYGLFVHGTWPGVYDMCHDMANLVQIQSEGPSLSFKIYTSKQPADIVKAHAMEAGPPILPPKWAFRPFRWRDNHKHQAAYYEGTPVKSPYNSDLVEDILMMEALGIPCGVYWVDRPWGSGSQGYDDFNWDPNRFPNAEAMIQWVKSKNTRFMLWIAPWVMGDMYAVAVEKKFDLIGQTNHKPGVISLDFTNPQAVSWWQQEGLAKVLRQGVDGFKLDRGEEGMPESRDLKVFDGRTTREIRNDYPVQYIRAVYQVCQQIKGDDFLLMPRAAYTGSTRYGVFWGGDIASPPEGLRAAIIAQLRSAVMGYPVWGSDTGGYGGGDIDREVMARWLAFSCFSPLMEVGPTDDRGLWQMKKEPSYDVELIAIWRMYAILHDKLVEYSYACATEAYHTGMPIARPLFLAYPDQKDAWSDWPTYLYGPDILVSAIWEKGKAQHECYLPTGSEWIDAWDKKVYPGGLKITLQTPLYKIPLFIRKGSAVDLGDLNALYQESLAVAQNRPDMNALQQKAFGTSP